MPWKVNAPTFNAERKCYIITIKDPPVVKVTTTDPTQILFEGVTKEQFDTFCVEFLKQASPYFSKVLDAAVFNQRLAHVFSTDEFDLEGGSKEWVASWIPAQVTFFASRYEVLWVLTDLEEKAKHSPGASATVVVEKSPDIVAPAATDVSRQKIIRQRIRQARLKCALAKLHVERLAERYYAKYGGFDGFSDSESELSSDFEFSSNES